MRADLPQRLIDEADMIRACDGLDDVAALLEEAAAALLCQGSCTKQVPVYLDLTQVSKGQS